jgi:hypothetical protein
MLQGRFRVLVPLVLALFIVLPAFGNTITVTNTSDTNPPTPGSLRAAIAAAAPGDTIDFNLTYPATIALNSTLGPLGLNTSLTISGPGASNLAISGNNAVRVLYVSQGVTVGISGVTIENGHSSYGGGIYNYGGTLTLTNITVSGNSAVVSGGGVWDYSGTLTLTNSTVADNSAAASYGGGIYISNSKLTITDSTVSGNSASYYGGGIYNSYTELSLTNSTVSGNSTKYSRGGGIFNYGGTLTSTNTTFAGNSAPADAGGIDNWYATLALKNTVLANNHGGNCLSTGGATSHGYNLSDDTTCTAFLTSNDKNNVSAGLDSNGLQDNGGPTKTIALLPTSPAVDAVPIADCTLSDGTTPLATDQRGVARPEGSACDMGAFELVGSASFSSFSVKLDIHAASTATIPPTSSSFDLNSELTLGASSNGIDPLTEVVKLQVGTYDVTIPVGSFHQLKRGAKQGSWVFSGVINSVSVSIQIVPLGGNSYQFKAEGSPVNLSELSNPVTVTVTIGDDTGSASVYADF